MECKYREARRFFDNKVELIETLWNVNNNKIYGSLGLADELIETLWNVNTGLLVWFYRRNRN